MKVTPPSNPFHLARAYNVAPPTAVTPARPTSPVEAATPIRRNANDHGAKKQPTNIDRLVAAHVPGRIDFTADAPRPDVRTESIPLYRHPADLNAAATNIHAGRTIDVSG